MRFVAGQGAGAQSHREDVAGQGAVAESHREDVAGRGAAAERLQRGGTAAERLCGRVAAPGTHCAENIIRRL